MNARRIALALLVVTAPTAAFAQSEGQAGWSLGAGIAPFGNVLVLAPPSSGGAYPLAGAVPLATAFLERRVGARTWLVFVGTGTASRTRSETADDGWGYSTEGETDLVQASLAIGLRRLVTRPGSIVDLSLVASAGGGHIDVSEERTVTTAGTESSELEGRGSFAFADAGIAIERALTDALALRISTPLVQLSWSRYDRTASDSDVTVEYESVGASVTIAPRLELRLAF